MPKSNRYFLFLGTQTRLSRAEALSVIPLYSEVELVKDHFPKPFIEITASTEDLASEFFARLGGSIKISRVLENDLDFSNIADSLIKIISVVKQENKTKIALSIHDQGNLSGSAKDFKKELIHRFKEYKVKARLSGRLNQKVMSSASVYHTLKKGGIGIELIYLNDSWQILETLAVQDIAMWRMADRKRPYIDMSEVGMLPPKLGRIMLNLAQLTPGETVWDPFCGTGTMLLQALLIGVNAFGSDLNQKNTQGSQDNIEWLGEQGLISEVLWQTFKFDVLDDPYSNKILRDIGKNEKFSAIVTEPYLGPIDSQKFRHEQQVRKYWQNIIPLYKSLLTNATKMVQPGKRLVIVKPAFRYSRSMWYNPKVAYNRNRWILLGEHYNDLVWRSRVKQVRRHILVFEKVK